MGQTRRAGPTRALRGPVLWYCEARMKLHTFRKGPNPLKARLALAERGLEYEAREIDLFKREHHTPEFAALNPIGGGLPVLEDGTFKLFESNAILAYLGRKPGGRAGLWPTDPQGEANALQWLFFESVHLSIACGIIWWNDRVRKVHEKFPGHTEEAVADEAEDLESRLNGIELHLAANPYFLGRDFSLVDCSLGTTLSMLRPTRLGEFPRWPATRAYVARIAERPSWNAAGGDGILNP